MDPLAADVTTLVNRLANGDQQAAAQLVPLIYDELHRLAIHRLRHERRGHTLQATALVHEVYLKLAGQPNARWKNRTQFFAVASRLMRHILVDYARAQQRIRRGGRREKIALDEVLLIAQDRTEEVLAVHESLSRLEKMDSRQGRIVELRYFGGLTMEETAEVLHVSPKTVMREWNTAKAWLYGELKECRADDARGMEQGKGAI
jgi:RNA polymerase sigma-70 factor (ECF subfamily)